MKFQNAYQPKLKHVAFAITTGYLLQHAIWDIEEYLCRVYGIGGEHLFSCNGCVFIKSEIIITFILCLLGIIITTALLLFRYKPLYIVNLVYFAIFSALMISNLISLEFSFFSVFGFWDLLVLLSVWYMMYRHRSDLRKPKENLSSITTNNL